MARIVMALGLALLAAACSSAGTDATREGSPKVSGAASPRSIASLGAGATPVQMIVAQSGLTRGEQRLAFGLITKEGGLVTGGSPQVLVAETTTSEPVSTATATWHEFLTDATDKAPRSPLKGFYTATVTVPRAGTWKIAASLGSGGERIFGTAPASAVARPVVAAIGSKAITVKTPVAKSEAQAKRICTRPPPDDLHAISLDEALKNGKPTVVNFGTPLLCESRLCGPVVDEVIAARDAIGGAKANFIHVEEFLPGADLTPPPATAENASPAFKKWGFETEPWVIVIDGQGVIRARFEGPVVASEIEAAVRALQ